MSERSLVGLAAGSKSVDKQAGPVVCCTSRQIIQVHTRLACQLGSQTFQSYKTTLEYLLRSDR